MTDMRQLSNLDAATVAQLTSHFDPLPGALPAAEPPQSGRADPQPGWANRSGGSPEDATDPLPNAQPAAEPPAGADPAGDMGVLVAHGALAAHALAGPVAKRLEPASFAALRAVLARDGRFCPRLPEPLQADPRPDLKDDHGRWNVLLALVWARDEPDPYGVYGALYGVRCCGAALITDAQPLGLTPEGPPLHWRLTRGETPEPEWQAYRARWLWPHKAVLTKLLQGGASA